MPSSPEGLCAAHGKSDQVHAYRANSQWGLGMNGTDSTTQHATRVLHSEVISDHFEGAKDSEGHPLVHAEGTSKPIRERTHEPQPRAARDRGNRPVDQVEAAERFIAATEHEKAHDERLWDMRLRRDKAAHALPEWEDMRSLASQIKEHALAHLDSYLEQFEAAAKANGVVVHWAADAAEHNRIVHGILKERGAKTLIKSKSMLTDECRITGEQPQENRQVLESRNDLLDADRGDVERRRIR